MFFCFFNSCFNKGQTLAPDFPKSLIILPDSDHVTQQPIRILRTTQEEGGCLHLDLNAALSATGKKKTNFMAVYAGLLPGLAFVKVHVPFFSSFFFYS